MGTEVPPHLLHHCCCTVHPLRLLLARLLCRCLCLSFFLSTSPPAGHIEEALRGGTGVAFYNSCKLMAVGTATIIMPVGHHLLVLPSRQHSATTVLPQCYHSATTVLPQCYHSATTVLPSRQHSATVSNTVPIAQGASAALASNKCKWADTQRSVSASR